MDINVVLLWTDALIFLLTGVITGFIFYTRNRPHLVAPWRQVFQRRLGIASLIVLCAFVLVGLTDSIHYQKQGSGEVVSLFDKLTHTLHSQSEKTYSAPFATQLYTKETIELPDGSSIRDYPRLKFGGAHLENVNDKTSDIVWRVVSGIVISCITWLFVCALCMGILSRRHNTPLKQTISNIWDGNTLLPWKTVLGTVGVILLLLGLAAQFIGYYHVFGTDKVGQDVLYLTLKSIRTGLVIGTLTTLIMLPFAILLGIMAGYFRGWIDDVIQYLYTTLNSIPGILLIAAAVLLLDVFMANHPDMFNNITSRADARLLFLCIILGVTSWTGLCRLLRGEALKLREVDYIQAATAFGVSKLSIIRRHILPNVMHIVMISIVLDFSGLVLAEAVLSYVGVGVDPSMNSWGNMINAARLEMAREPIVWWLLMAAFIFMFILVLCANLFADAVRDAFDPRLRGQG